MNHGQPSRPANVENIVAINQGRQPLAMELPVVPGLTAAQVLAKAADAIFVDLREPAAFGASHIPGAVNLQLSSSQFEQRVGWVLPGEAPLVLVPDKDSDIDDAIRKLAFIGLQDRVVGYLVDGMRGWEATGERSAQLPQIQPVELEQALLLRRETWQVLDVREVDEWDEGRILGARHMSYKQLGDRWDTLGLDPEQPIVVACAGGYRSSTASSILLRHGFLQVVNLVGGMDAWRAANLPLVVEKG